MRSGLVLILYLLLMARLVQAQPGVYNLADLTQPNPKTPGTLWRWQAGDNPAWATPELDDSRWDTIRPHRQLHNVAKAGISWFRLAILADSGMADKPLPLSISLNGAAEIYLDGNRLFQLGRVGKTPSTFAHYKRVKGDMHLLPGLSTGRHLLAIRFAAHPTPRFTPRYIENNQTLSVRFNSPATFGVSVADEVHQASSQTYLVIGLFLMLASIHFLYYLYRRRSINLIFGSTMLLYCLGGVANDLPNFIRNLTVAAWTNYLGTVLSMSFAVMLLATYYTYLQRKRNWLFGLLAGYSLGIALVSHLPMSPILHMVVVIARGLAPVLLFLDGFRISLLAIRNKQYNAVLVLVSGSVLIGVVVLAAFLLIGLNYYGIKPSGSTLSVFGTILSVSVPVVLAILLAKEHDQTNSDLQNRLAEVEKLSTEKEAILTQQNEQLEQRVAKRTAKLNQSLIDLRATQTQLVQREKMASLGELTAGIAHEIQNPLNFVNNFAELSTELLDELKQEQARPLPERDPALEAELLGDIHQNVGKIGQHGQRAASIVRGMLQHARSSTGEKEPTDLNALGDEYLRLSYHGMRRLDGRTPGEAGFEREAAPRFNVILHTSLDPMLEPIHVVNQEISRVLLNLFNNAFYAVREKALTSPEGYFPTVWFITRQLPDGVQIQVKDNGTGIPEPVQHKIFQPFFTTKPTGQGTGLGLSLSFDIITKGHGGTLAVESVPGQHTTFTIWLPAGTLPASL